MLNKVLNTVSTNVVKPPIASVVNRSENKFVQPDLKPADGVYGKALVTGSDFDNLDVLFETLKDKDGKEFADAAYKGLVKIMGLEGSAPSKITWEKNEGRPIIGDYRFYNNTIVFYTDYFFKQDKAEQLATIAHELTHCKQTVNVLCTEGIPVERYAYAFAVSDLRAALVRNPHIIDAMKKAKAAGKEKELTKYLISQWTLKTADELKEAHAYTLALPKHPFNSPAGKKAQLDLQAQFNYNGADMTTYNVCPLEKEARIAEKMIITLYKNYNNQV